MSFRVRKNNMVNRYELEVENFVTKMHGTADEVWESIVSTSVDYAERRIAFKVYDLQGGLTERFFDQLDEDPQLTVRLRIKRHDGQTDYVKNFHQAKIISRALTMTIERQTPLLHHVMLSYERADTEMVNDDI